MKFRQYRFVHVNFCLKFINPFVFVKVEKIFYFILGSYKFNGF